MAMSRDAQVRLAFTRFAEQAARLYARWDATGDENVTSAELGIPAHALGCCAVGAHVLAHRLGGLVCGYQHDANPRAVISSPSGHDFALVDGRWVVDWWATEYDYWATSREDRAHPGVLDLRSAADARRAARWYGDPRTWDRRAPVADVRTIV